MFTFIPIPIVFSSGGGGGNFGLFELGIVLSIFGFAFVTALTIIFFMLFIDSSMTFSQYLADWKCTISDVWERFKK